MERRHKTLLEVLLWIAASLIAIGVVLLVAELLADDPSSVIVAGSLGLILTETVALIAALMRRASETESERRLLMDSGMRAIELIQSPEQGGSTARSGAALVVLSRLDHLDLALTLLEALWPEERVNPEAATVVIDRGLRSQDKTLQATAASLLSHNGAKTVPTGVLYFLPADTVIRLNSFMPIILGIAGLDDAPVELKGDLDHMLRTTAVHLVQVVMTYEKISGVSGIPSHDRELPFDELERSVASWISGHTKANMALFRRIMKIRAAIGS
jgi:hypothetical protein